MATMKLPLEIVELPKNVVLQRNGLPVIAGLRELALVECADGRITLGDARWIASFRSINVSPGAYRVAVYEWQHPRRGIVNVALLIASCGQWSGRLQPISVEQDFAPHLAGLPVDSAAVRVRIGDTDLTVASGLGDGAYPVYARKPLAGPPNLLLVDFRLWEVRDYVERPGWEMDEYGLPFETGK